MLTLPGFTQLAATAEILRALLLGVTRDQAQWKPAPDRWSIAEALEHLSHTEGHYYRTNVELVAEQENPVIGTYDQEAYAAAGQYSGRDAEDSFDHFEEQREDNLAYLKSLPAGVEERTARHARSGPVTLANLLNEWAFHDAGHIRQIAELVRAIRYLPNMGPLGEGYEVHP
jgi:hypothetical protein